MINQRMLERITRGLAADVSSCERTIDGDYILDLYVPNIDYCVLTTEEWIWSIGRRRSDGIVLASTTTKFYPDSSEYECVWLR